MITELCKRAYMTANSKGFHEFHPIFGVSGQSARHILSWLMLVTTEVAEAAEEVRKGTIEKFGEELADIVIRVFDIAYALGVDLEFKILEKMNKNDLRPHMNGGKRA